MNPEPVKEKTSGGRREVWYGCITIGDGTNRKQKRIYLGSCNLISKEQAQVIFNTQIKSFYPDGYSRNVAGLRYGYNEQERNIIEKIRYLYGNGTPKKSIAEYLNDAGLTTRNGVAWDFKSVTLAARLPVDEKAKQTGKNQLGSLCNDRDKYWRGYWYKHDNGKRIKHGLVIGKFNELSKEQARAKLRAAINAAFPE